MPGDIPDMRVLAVVAALTIAACESPADRALPPFSTALPGGELPSPWRAWSIDPRKAPTRYTLVEDGGRTVLRAEAAASVSGVAADLRIEPAATRVRWRWKAERLPASGGEHEAGGDDSAARLVVSFTGDHGRLDPAERAKLSLAAALSGREAPYATLMYIWSAKHAAGTQIPNPRTSRVRMIVVEQGTARLGRWLEYERDLAADYRRAFGEAPGPIIAIAVLTDADDTQSSALAYYGDIVLR